MTRLTNDQRAAIIRAVEADMPPLVDNSEAIRKRIRELNLAALPPAVRRIAEDSKLAGYLETHSVYIEGVGSFAIFTERDSGWSRYDTTYLADATVVALVKASAEQTSARATARNALKAAGWPDDKAA